jgi:hypothetical protein
LNLPAASGLRAEDEFGVREEELAVWEDGVTRDEGVWRDDVPRLSDERSFIGLEGFSRDEGVRLG